MWMKIRSERGREALYIRYASKKLYIPLCRDGVAKHRTTPSSFHRCLTVVKQR